jgi:hypothetical protein
MASGKPKRTAKPSAQPTTTGDAGVSVRRREASGARAQQTPQRFAVFVSSTYDDLAAEREAVANALLKAGHIPQGMEQFGASNDRGWGIVTDTIDLCDYHVVVVGGRYGSVDDSGLSWTEKEFDYALEKGNGVLAFIRDRSSIKAPDQDTGKQKRKLDAFIKRLKNNHFCRTWKESADLSLEVVVSLFKEIKRDEDHGSVRRGWYRGDGPSILETKPAEVHANAKPAELRVEVAQPTGESKRAPVAAVPDPWARCGNIYWLAHNIVGAAHDISLGGTPYWRGAITHAQNVPIPSIWVDEIRACQKGFESDSMNPAIRVAVANRLLTIAVQIGRLIQSHQPDFPERDPGPGPV